MSQPALARIETDSQLYSQKPPRLILALSDDAAATRVGDVASKLGFQVFKNLFDLRNLFEGPILPEMVVVLYSQHGTNTIRFSGEHVQPKGYDFSWHWAVALNPKMHLKKIQSVEQAAKSIAFTFGWENFQERFCARQSPWGGISLARSEEFDRDPMKYFRSNVLQVPTDGK